MSIEPQHHSAVSSTPFGTALAEFSSRGWTVQRTIVGRRSIATVIGPMGIVVLGEAGVEARTLHSRAGAICADLPAHLRRHVRVIESDQRATLADLPTVLTADEVDAAVVSLTTDAPEDTLTVAKVLEWTRHAKPEPTRPEHHSPLTGAATWLTRHAVLFAVIALGVALLAIVGLSTQPGPSLLGATSAPQSQTQADTPSVAGADWGTSQER